MSLPKACAKCEPTGGAWVIGATGGGQRCDCPRGRALLGLSKEDEPQEPVLPSEDATIFVEMMSGLAFFPGDVGFRVAVGNELRAMCRTKQEAFWIVTRMNRLYDKWPGLAEMRRVYCASGRRPLDAVAALGESTVYPEGIPAEGPQSRPAEAVLTAGPSRDPEMRRLVGEVAERKRL